LRRQFKAAASRLLSVTGGDRFYGVLSGQRRSPLIVGYHRVVESLASMQHTSIVAMLTSRRTFEEQIDCIARRYRITTLDEIGSHLESGEPFEKRVAAVTFDDGYADVYHNAFPILRRKGLPSAVFVVTDLIGHKTVHQFDRLYLLLSRELKRPGAIHRLREMTLPHAATIVALGKLRSLSSDPTLATQAILSALSHEAINSVLETLESSDLLPLESPESQRPLDWRMLEEMAGGGVTIGSHTRRHPLLTFEAPEVVLEELVGSREVLGRRLGCPIRHFAYPDGQFSTPVVAAVKKAGYRFGYGICGHRDLLDPLLTIPRRVLWENSCLDGRGRFSSSVMHCNTNGVFDIFARCARNHQAVGVDDGSRPQGCEAN
jgi:peptidoglycan/xylan/chitin deacetylase (PgdA/CDA1 family)